MPTKRRFARSPGTDTDEVSDQLVRTGTDLTPEHHELLGAAIQFRVRGSLSALGDTRGGSIVYSSTGLRPCPSCLAVAGLPGCSAGGC